MWGGREEDEGAGHGAARACRRSARSSSAALAEGTPRRPRMQPARPRQSEEAAPPAEAARNRDSPPSAARSRRTRSLAARRPPRREQRRRPHRRLVPPAHPRPPPSTEVWNQARSRRCTRRPPSPPEHGQDAPLAPPSCFGASVEEVPASTAESPRQRLRARRAGPRRPWRRDGSRRGVQRRAAGAAGRLQIDDGREGERARAPNRRREKGRGRRCLVPRHLRRRGRWAGTGVTAADPRRTHRRFEAGRAARDSRPPPGAALRRSLASALDGRT